MNVSMWQLVKCPYDALMLLTSPSLCFKFPAMGSIDGIFAFVVFIQHQMVMMASWKCFTTASEECLRMDYRYLSLAVVMLVG